MTRRGHLASWILQPFAIRLFIAANVSAPIFLNTRSLLSGPLLYSYQFLEIPRKPCFLSRTIPRAVFPSFSNADTRGDTSLRPASFAFNGALRSMPLHRLFLNRSPEELGSNPEPGETRSPRRCVHLNSWPDSQIVP